MKRHTRTTLLALPLLLTTAAAVQAQTRESTTNPAAQGQATSPTAAPQILTGKVTAVTSGDTITVLDDKKSLIVRLVGIDAPEQGQPFFNEARQFLSRSLLNQNVRVVSRGTEANGRVAADVYLRSGASQSSGPLQQNETIDPTGTQRDLPRGLPGRRASANIIREEQYVNQEMVREGWAWVDIRRVPQHKNMMALQADARRARRGLWAGARPTPPWQYNAPQSRNNRPSRPARKTVR